jgi:hypothetical protein
VTAAAEQDFVDRALAVDAQLEQARAQLELCRALEAVEAEAEQLSRTLAARAEVLSRVEGVVVTVERVRAAGPLALRPADVSEPRPFDWRRAARLWACCAALVAVWSAAALAASPRWLHEWPNSWTRPADRRHAGGGLWQFQPWPLSVIAEPVQLSPPPGPRGQQSCLPNHRD